MGIKLWFQSILGLRPHKDTEAKRLNSEFRHGVEVCKEKAAKGDSDASLRLGALKQNLTEQSIRLSKGKALATLLMVGLLCLAGCSSINKEFVDRMDAPAKILLPDLQKVYRGEPLDLSDPQKARRLLLLEEWLKTIKEAKTTTEK